MEIVLQHINEIKKKALAFRASDIILSAGSVPAYRVHGEIHFFEDEKIVTNHFLERYLSVQLGIDHHKILSEKSEFDFAINANKSGIRFRVNAFWQMSGLSIVFRHIPDEIPNFESAKIPEVLKKVTEFKNGLVLVTGSMGSGKSTTLAAIIDYINTHQGRHVITIEDPIEFIHKNKKSLIEQRELQVHTQDPQKAIIASLRQATDIVSVGELRDTKTIHAAITAAETGALVLGTLHTNGAKNSINRIIDVFPAAQQNQIRTQLSEVLKCVAWQVLVPGKDHHMLPAFEILFQNYAVSNLIRENKIHQIGSVIEMGRKEGMQNMKESLRNLVESGLVDGDLAEKILNSINPHE